ncbi:MAG: hypothetical protein R2762_08205 [Bryobacteraceae bacterium]
MNLILALFLAANLDWVSGLGGRVETNSDGKVSAVNLRGAWVTDADLDLLASVPTLEKIDLSLSRVTDLGLLRLKDLPNVRELNLFFAELVTDEGLAAMRNWKHIERLNLRGTKVTDNTLALLAGKESIVALDIGYAEVTDSGLQHLPKLPNLRELAFGGNKMTEIGLEVLRALPHLTRLDIAGRQRTDSGLWYVAFTDVGLDPILTLTELRELNLAGSQVSSKGIQRLSALKHLERLNLYGANRVNDEAAQYLAALPALRWVDLKDTAVTAKGFASLRTSRPGLAISGDPALEPVESFKIELESQSFRAVRIRLGPNENLSPGDHPKASAVVYAGLDGAVRVSPSVPDTTTGPAHYLRVELNGKLAEKPESEKTFEPVTVATDSKTRHVLFENTAFSVLRLSCPSRANCPPSQGNALDVTLGTGATAALRAGAPARYNETPLPLELIRIELK